MTGYYLEIRGNNKNPSLGYFETLNEQEFA